MQKIDYKKKMKEKKDREKLLQKEEGEEDLDTNNNPSETGFEPPEKKKWCFIL